ncbi:hypothetical protein B0T22DRAFT_126797 [Podospora appendiculata]|uniref:Uncharacterized protein n=1 Tax=Podospora appendiculata TaxID=314037 RepID=A0AAE1CBE6_9PEZI|nr:hypothetical protein B0T22DRAFT_126797 [Podospora appendiculata]
MTCSPVDRDYFLLGVGSWATPKSPVPCDGRAKAPIPASSPYVLAHNQDVLAQHAPQPEASPTRSNESMEHCPPSPGTTTPTPIPTTTTTTTTIICAKSPPPETASDLQPAPEPPAQASPNKKTLQRRSPARYPTTYCDWEELTASALWYEKTFLEWISFTLELYLRVPHEIPVRRFRRVQQDHGRNRPEGNAGHWKEVDDEGTW